MRERPVIISFVGPSGSGKTAIIEKLIREFGRRGLRVGAVKHSRAGFSLDRSGKDSARFKRAGAGTVLLLSPSSLGLIADYSGTLSPREAAARFFPDADIILVEGWKESALPKILVQGTARRRGVTIRNIVAEVGTRRPYRDIPLFPPAQPSRIAGFILLKRRALG